MKLPDVSLYVVYNFLTKGRLFDEETTEEYRKSYPNTVGFIITTEGFSGVGYDDIKAFEKFKKYCDKNNLSLIDELKNYWEENACVSFDSKRGKKLLKDAPFNFG